MTDVAYDGDHWRVLLGNKTKSIKALNSVYQASYQFIQKVKVFTGLESVTISGYLPDWGPTIDEYATVICQRVSGLRNLRSLYLDMLRGDNQDFLKELGSFPRILGSLRTFHINCDPRDPYDLNILTTIISQKNIGEFLTNLRLGSLCTPFHYALFQGLADSCPKLKGLAFKFSGQAIPLPFHLPRKLSEVNYLATLKALHSLTSLELGVGDAFTCLKDLVLPPLNQNLVLSFEECLSKEIMRKIDPKFSKKGPKIFEENKTLLRFYDQFKSLGLLETLRIDFKEETSNS